MIYVSPEGNYPTFYGEIELAHKGWKFGDPLPNGWREVIETDAPSLGENEIAYEEFPIEVDGQLVQNWQVRAMTDEEIARRNAPETVKAKLLTLDLTDDEKDIIRNGVFL